MYIKIALRLFFCSLPSTLSDMSQFKATNFINETSETSHMVESQPSHRILSVVNCADACSGSKQCTRFKFCQKKYGEDGVCTLYQSGRNCRQLTDDGGQCYCYILQFAKHENGSCQRCPIGYYGDGEPCCSSVIEDCTEGQGLQHLRDRGDVLSFIKPASYPGEPFEVVCHFGYDGLTFIQSRRDRGIPVNFNRSWQEYMTGFGYAEGSHWLGFDKITHLLNPTSSTGGYKMDIGFFRKSDDMECIITLDNFSLGKEDTRFKINHGDKGHSRWCYEYMDQLNIKDQEFSTFDHDFTDYNCSSKIQAGWWFNNNSTCTNINANGPYSLGTIVLNPTNHLETVKEIAIKVNRK